MQLISGYQDRPVQAAAANFYISKFFRLAKRNGLNAVALLENADIPKDIVGVAERRVEAGKLAAFVIAICDQLNDESMSLSASPLPRGSFYMMGKLTVHEPELKKALLQMKRFFDMLTSIFSLNLEIENDAACLSFDLKNPEMDPDHLFSEFNLLMLHRYSSWLIGENIPLLEVTFSYPVPEQVKEYAFLFPGKHRFNASKTGFTFSRHFLEHATVQNVATLKSFMHRCPMELFSQPKTDFSLGGDIHALLSKSDSDAFPSLQGVAIELLLTKRTLIRKLKEEGTSFQQIKDAVRRDKAIDYLSNKFSSVNDAAIKAGFSDASAFTRAFKSWTGLTPSEYRANYL